jgi:hypothetical protein
MGVNAGVKTHALDSPDHLCDLALVDRAQLGFPGVKNLASGGGEIPHEGEVLTALVWYDFAFQHMIRMMGEPYLVQIQR